MSFDGLPEFKHEFVLDVVGKATKKPYKGNFVFLRPTIANLGNIARYKATLNGGANNIDPNIDFLHEMLAQLRFTIIEAPAWWKDSNCGENFYDINVIVALYNEWVKFEGQFDKELDEKANPKVEEKKNA